MFLLLVLTFPLALFALLLGMERVEQPLRGERARGITPEGAESLVAREHTRSAEHYAQRRVAPFARRPAVPSAAHPAAAQRP
ncbi:MAG: hypothetical protein ACYDB7_09050 [Mycobacteriales bacterium]